jgi:hypothetical protein
MMTLGLVTAVHYEGNEILVTVNGQKIPLSSISAIKQSDKA